MACSRLDSFVEQIRSRLESADAETWLARLAKSVADGDPPTHGLPPEGTEIDAAVRDALRRAQAITSGHGDALDGLDLPTISEVLSALAELAPRPHCDLASRALLAIESQRPSGTIGADEVRSNRGRRVGVYMLQKPLGSGASGAVHLATHRDNGMPAAVKLLRAEMTDPEQVARFRREARIAARLNHPSIVRLLDSGVDESDGIARPFLVWELVPGRPFAVATRGRSIEFILDVFAKVCEGIVHAHARGVLHRDIKSSNVLVDDSGHARVLDFGIARLTDSDEAQDTRTGQILGTLAAMSPEQAAGRPLDGRSDLWSLAALLFDALTGHPPHEITNQELPVALRRIAETEPRRLASLRPDLPIELAAIVDKALSLDPGHRYPDVSAFHADVRRLIAGDPVAARAPTPWQSTRRLFRRHRVAAVGVLAIATSVAIGGAIALIQWRRAVTAEQILRGEAAAVFDVLQSELEVAAHLVETATGTEEQMRLLGAALASANRLRDQQPDSAGVRWLGVEARLRELLGDLALRMHRPDSARAERQQVLALMNQMRDLGAPAPLDEARAIVKLGDLERAADGEAALRLYEQAHQIFRQLTRPEGASVESRDDLGWSYERLAFMSRQLGRTDASIRLARERVELAWQLLEEQPDALRHYGLACGVTVLALCLIESTDAPAARILELRRQACEHVMLAVRDDPGRRAFVLAAVAMHRHLADTELRVAGPATAPPARESARALIDAWIVRDGRDVDARVAAIPIYEAIASNAEGRRDDAAASAAWEAAFRHAEAAHLLGNTAPEFRAELARIARLGFDHATRSPDTSDPQRWAERVTTALDSASRSPDALEIELADAALWFATEAPEEWRSQPRAHDLAQEAITRCGPRTGRETIQRVHAAAEACGIPIADDSQAPSLSGERASSDAPPDAGRR